MVSLVPVFIFAVCVAVLILVLSLLGRRKRRKLWESFAASNNLQVLSPRSGRRMELVGQFNDRTVTIRPAGTSSDTGDLGVEEVEFRVSLKGNFPSGFRVEEGGALERSIDGGWQFEEGEAEDQWLEDYFNAERRAAIQELMELGDPGRSGLEAGQIHMVDREFIPRAETLRERLESLLALAPRLDTRSRNPRGE